MKQNKNKVAWIATLLLLLFVSNPCFLYAEDVKETKVKLVADGPYLFYENNDQIRSISITAEEQIIDTVYQVNQGKFTFPVYSHEGKFLFETEVRPEISRDHWQIDQAKKVFVTSDPHGDFDTFADLLKTNKVIDEKYNWTYGKNQLVVIGDVFDRGKDVLPLFWLVYKLEAEAAKKGGQVVFLLGNHEPMVLGGDLRYVKKSYLAFAEKLGVPYESLFGPTSVLGDWLHTKNTIQLIGDNLFVHAGISADLVERGYTIPQVNKIVSDGLFYHRKIRKKQSDDLDFLYGNRGPIWYRGMVRDKEKYNPITPIEVNNVLAYFNVERIIVGHTIFPEISHFFDKRVIAVNLNNKKNKINKGTRALLIKKNKFWIVSDASLVRL